MSKTIKTVLLTFAVPLVVLFFSGCPNGEIFGTINVKVDESPNGPPAGASGGISLSDGANPVLPAVLSLTQTGDNITITNNGSEPTGTIDVRLGAPNAADFSLSGDVFNNAQYVTVSSIAPGETGIFAITPTNLSSGAHLSGVTVSGAAGISASFAAAYIVGGSSGDEISLFLNPGITPVPVVLNLTDPSGTAIKVQNNDLVNATNALTASLGGGASSKFEFPNGSIGVLSGGVSAVFTVRPKAGVTGGPWVDSVTVSDGADVSASFIVVYMASAPNISLNPSGLLNLGTAHEVGYTNTNYTSNDITVTNNGTASTGTGLGIALAGNSGGVSDFTLSKSATSVLAADGGSDTFTVRPKSNLAPGLHMDMITVSGGGVSASLAVTFTVGSSGLSLNPGGFLDLGAVTLSGTSYTPPSQNVTITNNDTGSSGSLTVFLKSNPSSSFLASPAHGGTISAIAGNGGMGTFTITTKSNLLAGAYIDTVTLGNGGSLSASLVVSFTVNPPANPLYGISLDKSGLVNRGSDSSPLSVVITNTGSLPAGVLTVELGGAGSSNFQLTNNTGINFTSTSATANFTVSPKTGLVPGVYTDSVRVSGDNGISASFTVMFTVTGVNGISVSPAGGVFNFSAAAAGYVEAGISYNSFTITNSGSQPTGALTVSVRGAGRNAFRLNTADSNWNSVTNLPLSIASVGTSGGTQDFYIKPALNQNPGVYTAVISVDGPANSGQHAELTVTFTVNLTVNSLVDWTAVRAWLNNKSGSYTVTVAPDIVGYPKNIFPSTSTFSGFQGTITLDGNGSLNSQVDGTNFGSLIQVTAGQTLILNGPTLKGQSGNTNAVIEVTSTTTPAAFIMRSGAIQGNTNTGNGGGVYVHGSAASFTMRGGTISGNTAGGDGGGGVYFDSPGTFTMSGGTIGGTAANSANSAGSGAGVYMAQGNLVMSGGTISGNTANDEGGGVYITGSGSSFTMPGGTINGNTGDFGGGVFIDEDSVFTMSGSAVIRGNTAGTQGGGICSEKGQFIMRGGTISGNTVTGGSGFGSSGGGLFLNGAPAAAPAFDMSGGIIANNSADSGGGVHIEAGAGQFILSGSAEIRGNTSTVSGGGMRISCLNFTMNGGTIADNTLNISTSNGDEGGGGVYLGCVTSSTTPTVFTMNGGTITGNTVTGGNGGGVLAITQSNDTRAASFIMNSGAIISGNSAVSGGGVYLYAGLAGSILGGVNDGPAASFIMRGGEIRDNTASGSGGGVYAYADADASIFGAAGGISTAALTMSGGSIRNNTAGGSGGGVYVYADNNGITSNYIPTAEFTMQGGSVSYNQSTANSNGGGGVYVSAANSGVAKFEMNGSSAIVSGNTANRYGGGVYITKSGSGSGSFTMPGGTISGNGGIFGGGVYVSSGSFTMSGSAAISNNTTTSSGAGVYNYGTFTMNGNAVISGNTAASGGNTYSSGAGVYTGGAFTMSGNAAISGNTLNASSDGNGGGGVYVDSYGTFFMLGGTISDNHAKSTLAGAGGGGVYSRGNVTMSGTAVISGNTAGSYGGGVYFYNNSSSTTFTMQSGTSIRNNQVSSDGTVNNTGGGGVYVSGVVSFTMQSGASVRNNQASSTSTNSSIAIFGGGMYIAGSANLSVQSGAYVSNNTLTGPANSGSMGGGVYFNSIGNLTMNGTVKGNVSNRSAGGLAIFSGGVATGTLTMNGTVSNNEATGGMGGGLIHDGPANLTMSGGTISNNKAGSEGGGIHVSSAQFIMSGGTISGNTATIYGGGVNIGSGSSTKFMLTNGSIVSNSISDPTHAGHGEQVCKDNTALFTSDGSTDLAGGMSGTPANPNLTYWNNNITVP